MRNYITKCVVAALCGLLFAPWAWARNSSAIGKVSAEKSIAVERIDASSPTAGPLLRLLAPTAGNPFARLTGANVKPPMRADAPAWQADCDLVANVVMGTGWSSNDREKVGLSKLERGAADWKHLKYDTYLTGANGVIIDDRFYGYRYATYQYSWVWCDMDDSDYWPIRNTAKNHQYGCEAMTWNHLTDKVWGVLRSPSGNQPYLCRFDELPADKFPEPERIGEIDKSYTCFGLGVSSDGTLYGVFGTFADTAGDATAALYTIDTATAALTKVGDVNVPLHYSGSATIYPKTDKMYLTSLGADNVGALYEVDITSGAAVKVFDYPQNQQVLALSWVKPDAEQGAPAIATDPAASFRGVSLSGTVDFTAPATLYNGDAATGTISWRVMADGVEAATGTASYGERVKAPVSVTAAGMHDFTVITSNSVGDSPELKFSSWVGADKPAPVENVALAYVQGRMVLTWDPLSKTEHDTAIDFNEVSYDVTRYPDGVKVAEGIRATSFTENIAEGETAVKYFYGVTAHYAADVSDETSSNAILVGSYKTPYNYTFNSDAFLSDFEVINANDDSRTWVYSFGCARVLENTAGPMDDWLISPTLYLEAGKRYCLTLGAFTWSKQYPAKIEARVGTGTAVADMTTVAIPPTELAWDTEQPVIGLFTVPASGEYHVGIHACSDKGGSHLHLASMALAEATMPAAPSNLTVTPAEDRSLKATLSFSAPDKSSNGETLTELTAVTVRRDGEVVKTFDSPAPGEALTYEDTGMDAGNHTYSVTASNRYGEGPAVTATAYVGIMAPRPVKDVKAISLGDGRVKLTWTAPATDIRDFPLTADQLSYKIYYAENGFWLSLDGVDPLKTTEVVLTLADQESEQHFMSLGVEASTAGGSAAVAEANLVAVGRDYEVPFYETVAGGALSHMWGVNEHTSTTLWALCNDSLIEGVTSQDGDNGFMVMQGRAEGDSGDFYSANINLGELDNPELSFFYYTFGPDNFNDISVYVVCEGTKYELDTFTIDGTRGWHKHTVSLRRFRGKSIQIGFTGIIYTYTLIPIDNIRIVTPLGYDIVATGLHAPAKVRQGDDVVINVTYYNNGSNDLEDGEYSVNLYRDGELLKSVEGKSLAAGYAATLSFTDPADALSAESRRYHVELTCDRDENSADNTTEAATVGIILNEYPAVEGLAARQTGANEITLTWNAPESSAARPAAPAEVVTEDFENHTSWTREAEAGWIFTDSDNSPVAGFQNVVIPGITTGETCAAFFVFDNSDSGTFNGSFATQSGTKCLASLARWDGGKADDWAISPTLSGREQVISFYARSYSADYPETLEVLYSIDGTDISDFIAIEGATFKRLSHEWTRYQVTLPAGAVHFALRSTATDAFMLMIDDVTFESGDGQPILEVQGYNIYRDGKLFATVKGSEPKWTDSNVEYNVTHSYVVTALYTSGEGQRCDPVSITAGIGNVGAGEASIAVEGLDIVITTPSPVSAAVVSASGLTLFNETFSGSRRIATSGGVYLVDIDGKVTKVAVR